VIKPGYSSIAFQIPFDAAGDGFVGYGIIVFNKKREGGWNNSENS